jgi:hypothetical protein
MKNKINIINTESTRIVVGDKTSSVDVSGLRGPTGPTGPVGPDPDPRLTRYYYGNILPTDAITGDKWFWTGGGVEFTYIRGEFKQLYQLFKKNS